MAKRKSKATRIIYPVWGVMLKSGLALNGDPGVFNTYSRDVAVGFLAALRRHGMTGRVVELNPITPKRKVTRGKGKD